MSPLMWFLLYGPPWGGFGAALTWVRMAYERDRLRSDLDVATGPLRIPRALPPALPPGADVLSGRQPRHRAY